MIENVFTDTSLINVLVPALAEFLSARLERKVVGNGLGKDVTMAFGPSNITATFRFDGESNNLCTLQYGQTDGCSIRRKLKLVLYPYLKKVNRAVYDELELIINTDIGIRRPGNYRED